jgi:hypothetical protein
LALHTIIGEILWQVEILPDKKNRRKAATPLACNAKRYKSMPGDTGSDRGDNHAQRASGKSETWAACTLDTPTVRMEAVGMRSTHPEVADEDAIAVARLTDTMAGGTYVGRLQLDTCQPIPASCFFVSRYPVSVPSKAKAILAEI